MTKHYDINWLIDSYESGETLKFIYFWGHSDTLNEGIGKFCLSQWFKSPFMIENKTYKTSEHWMMSQKALLFNDKKTFDKIISVDRPEEAKELGREVIGFDDAIWNDKRFEIVKIGNIHKFNQNPILADYLLRTGDKVLVEASPTDIVWGIGLHQDSKGIDNIYAWRGLNLLGFVLMEVRDFFNEFGHFKTLDNAQQTPWTMFPNIDKHDMFWTMGKGEDCIIQFYEYYNDLSDRDKIIFTLTNPAPYDWSDIYE
ncbi:MAG: NADAR family protein [Candidatus Kapabacteria bacterium]|nr:NADAR family protein [Candidatus Kapabacteria bacterium]